MQYKVFYTLNEAENKSKANIYDPAKKPELALTLEFDATNDDAAEKHLLENIGAGDERGIKGLTNLNKCRGSLKVVTIPVLIDLNTIKDSRLKTQIAEALSLVEEGLTCENGVYKVASLDLVNKPVKTPKVKATAPHKTDENTPRLKIGIPGKEGATQEQKDYVENLDVTPPAEAPAA